MLRAPLALLAGALAPCSRCFELPFKVQPIPEHFHGFEDFFDKYVAVLAPASEELHGLQVVATEGVPDSKVLRVANVLAEFLDNDGDGDVDNPKVVEAMQRHGATMIMFVDADELDKSGFDELPGYGTQDVEGDETGGNASLGAHVMTSGLVGPSKPCTHRPDLLCDAPLEEVFHLVTDQGYARAYPAEFSTKPGSVLSITMDGLIGTCGYAGDSPLGRHTRYRFPECAGTYHYADETCEYSCLATEYFHHFVASLNGEYAWNTRENVCGRPGRGRPQEWELCLEVPDGNLTPSRDLLARGDPDGAALILDEKYRVPQRMPRGRYAPAAPLRARHSPGPASPPAMPLQRFRALALEDGLRRARFARRSVLVV